MIDARSLGVETVTSDSALGRWTASAWLPPPQDELFGLVERVWDFDGVLALRREQIFPNGAVEFVVQLDEPHRPVRGVPGEPFPALCLDGLRATTATIEAPRGRCRVVGVRLRPLAAFALLGAPLAELVDRSVDLRCVLGRPASELAESLHAARTGATRVEATVAWLRRRAARPRAGDALVAAMLETIHRRGGRDPIAVLDELAGRSRSRAAERFREQVGLGPKRYARVVRFHRALGMLRGSEATLGLAAVAFASGYFDQAHFNAEFRAHAGCTPREYLRGSRFPGGEHLAHPAREDDGSGSILQDAHAGFA